MKRIRMMIILATIVFTVGMNPSAVEASDNNGIELEMSSLVIEDILNFREITDAKLMEEQLQFGLHNSNEIIQNIDLSSIYLPPIIMPESPVDILLPESPIRNMENTYTDYKTGDIISTSYDAATETTTVNIVAKRNNAPDVLTKTSPSGVFIKTVGINDTFGSKSTTFERGIRGNENTTIEIELKDSSNMNYQINEDNKTKYVSLKVDATSKWVVEGNSYLSVLTDGDASLSNIISNGYTVYYDSTNDENRWLAHKTYSLIGGGMLRPYK